MLRPRTRPQSSPRGDACVEADGTETWKTAAIITDVSNRWETLGSSAYPRHRRVPG